MNGKYWLRAIKVLILLTTLAASGDVVQAAEECFWGQLEVPLPGIDKDFLCKDKPPSLVQYADAIITFLTALIVIVGIISIIVGGYFYMTAGGSAERVTLGKTLIFGAIAGIALALMAWAILNTIGPQFTTNVKEPVIND